MPSLDLERFDLDNNLAPMDETHREFVECYNAAANAAPEDFLPALDRLIEHTKAHFDLENGWMDAVDFPGCHRAEHDRVLAVMNDIRKRVEQGDLFLGRRLMEELPAWFDNHVNGMDAALAFHLATIGFDVEHVHAAPARRGRDAWRGLRLRLARRRGCGRKRAPRRLRRRFRRAPPADRGGTGRSRRAASIRGEERKRHRRPAAAHQFGQRRRRAAGQRPSQRAVAGVEPQVRGARCGRSAARCPAWRGATPPRVPRVRGRSPPGSAPAPTP